MVVTKKTVLVCAPVNNLEISSFVGGEINIEEVTLISRSKMSRVRKRLGFDVRISAIEDRFRKQWNWGLLDKNTYAILRWKLGKGEKPVIPIRKIRDAIWILASSMFSASNRGLIEPFGLPGHELTNLQSYYIHDPSGNWSRASFSRKPPYGKNRLDSNWKNLMRNHFFPKILKIIEKKVTVNKQWIVCEQWRENIRKATIFAGRSILATDLDIAFMYDMIALESILTDGQGKHRTALIDRFYGLLPWYFDKYPGKWEAIIEHIYTLRCALVHDGETKDIKPEDLIHADILLENLLWNISSASKLIKNRTDLIELSEKIKAKQLLGLKVRSKFRARFAQPSNKMNIINRIEKNMEWG